MNLLFTSCRTSDAEGVLLIFFIIVIIVTILIIGSILKLYDISDSLKAHNAIMKEQQQIEKERNEILKQMLHKNDTEVTAPCTSDADKLMQI